MCPSRCVCVLCVYRKRMCVDTLYKFSLCDSRKYATMYRTRSYYRCLNQAPVVCGKKTENPQCIQMYIFHTDLIHAFDLKLTLMNSVGTWDLESHASPGTHTKLCFRESAFFFYSFLRPPFFPVQQQAWKSNNTDIRFATRSIYILNFAIRRRDPHKTRLRFKGIKIVVPFQD